MATSTIKLDDSGWLDISTGAGKYRKRNGIITVVLNKAVALTTSWQIIGNIPQGYRPDWILYQESININSGAANAVLYINNQGNIGARLNDGASSQTVAIGAVITYPV